MEDKEFKKFVKILYITPSYYPKNMGGSERSLKILAEGIAKNRNFQVTVLSFDNEKKEKSIENYNGVKVIRVKKLNIIPNTFAQNISLLYYQKYVRDVKPDIIHIYNTWHIPAGYFLKKYAKVIATLNNYYPICAISYTHDNFLEKEKATFFRLFKSIYKTKRRAKFLMALGYSIYSKLIQFYSDRLDNYIVYANPIKEIYVLQGYDENKIDIIPSFFEFSVNKKNKKVKRKDNTIMYAGGLSGSKGIMELLKAMKYVNKRIELLVFGVGLLEESVKDLVIKNDLNVKFFGKISNEELQEYMRSVSLLISPAQWPEPFSRIWIEALQNEVSIISSDNPVAEDILKGAIFYNRGNPKELAEKIEMFFRGEIKSDLRESQNRLFSQKPIYQMSKLYEKEVEAFS